MKKYRIRSSKQVREDLDSFGFGVERSYVFGHIHDAMTQLSVDGKGSKDDLVH